MRHYTNTYIYNEEFNAKSELILELAIECIHAYAKSIELSNYNPLALIGECRIRVIIVQYYFKVVCRESMDSFREKLKNPSTPHVITNSSGKISAYLEKLENLKFTSSQYYNISQLYFDFRIKLLKLYGCANLCIENIDNLPDDVSLNLYELYKHFRPDYSDWEAISERHLILMIVRLEKQIKSALKSKFPLWNNYKHSILAYIHIAHKSVKLSNEYSIERAIGLAKEWVRFFENDPDAYFYLGVLQFTKAIQSNNNSECFKEAKYNLRTCKDIYVKMKNPSAPKKIIHVDFLLGSEKGLRGLLMFKDDCDLKNLIKFKGTIVNENGRIFFNFMNFAVKCLDRNAFDTQSKIKGIEKGHDLQYSYHIAIRRLDLLAYKYQRI